MLPLGPLEKSLFLASLLASGGLLTVFVDTRLVDYHPDICPPLPMAFSLCVSLCPISPFYKNTSHALSGRAHLNY